jgi:hypothetical protein
MLVKVDEGENQEDEEAPAEAATNASATPSILTAASRARQRSRFEPLDSCCNPQPPEHLNDIVNYTLKVSFT